MTCALWDHSLVDSPQATKHDIGARSSFIPPLGRIIWRSSRDSIFDAYIFETISGKKIGYIRIPHYMGDEENLIEFGMRMNLFEMNTDAMVIDQINNPGGSLFYLYALASTLTNQPLSTPKHRIALTQEEVAVAFQMLPLLEQVTDDDEARTLFGESIEGYPVDLQFALLTKDFCNFLVDQWNSGHLFSQPTHLFGFDQLDPHPYFRYSKPILLLVNALDFSGGDFFPTILQDNKRATIMGVRTSGAGGYVISVEYPNQTGIKNFIMTGSVAERINHKPIENLGVVPDIKYELSVADLQENYREYGNAIVSNVERLIKNRS